MGKKILSIICRWIIVVSLFTIVIPGCTKSVSTASEPTDDSGGYEPTYAAPRVNSSLVVSYHQQSVDAGHRIFNAGGNAFDAFVAVTAVENVVSSGYVTFAGLLSVLIYHAGSNEVVYLDGGYNSVLDPAGAYDPQNPVIGKMVVVPGIVSGLAAISTRYGRLSFARVLQPAIEIAREGFPIDEFLAWCIQSGAEKLRGTEYGRNTYFPNGTLEHTTIQPLGHFSASADALEVVVRVARAVDEESWIRDHRYLDNRELVNSRLTLDYTDSIWAKVEGSLNNVYTPIPLSHHTLTSSIADTDGNVISGKHSINSELWGPGLFVQGIPLNGSGDFTGRDPGPGQRRTQGAPNFLVFKDGPLRYSCGTFGDSDPHTAFQFLVNLLDYELSTDQAAGLPRFGSFPYDEETWAVDYSKNWLDERVSQEIVDILAARGLYFQRRPRLGTGCIAEFHPDGTTITGWARR